MRINHLATLLPATCLCPVHMAVAGDGLLELLSELKDNGTISKAQYTKGGWPTYTRVDNHSSADDDGDVLGNDDPSIFQTRIQADF